ncbi:hypothetical protein MJD09_03380 [bacterium]|nr:hypothetical protein [bacterium]
MLTKKCLWGLLALLLLACGSASSLERVKRDLNRYPEYSIILEDMREEGNFFKDYYHRYKVVYGQKAKSGDELEYQNELTDWYKVDKKEYEKYANNLGMVLVSKSKDGKISDVAQPPGYQYVGDQRYGQWRRDSGGNSFWEFYGKYAFFSHMFGMFSRPIYRNDWDNYSDYRSRGRPYYGNNRQYGTNGTHTKRTHKTFHDRQLRKDAARKARFSQRVQQRTRRSNMSGARSRSRGFGK